MIGGGFTTDTHGYIFWSLVLIFILGFVFLIVSWKKHRNQNENLFLSIATIIILVIPFFTTVFLVKTGERIYMEQKERIGSKN